MAENEIIERICGSCNCDEATAKEYLNDEIRHLRELQEVNDLHLLPNSRKRLMSFRM